MSNPKYLERTYINCNKDPAVVLEFLLYVLFGIENILWAGGRLLPVYGRTSSRIHY